MPRWRHKHHNRRVVSSTEKIVITPVSACYTSRMAKKMAKKTNQNNSLARWEDEGGPAPSVAQQDRDELTRLADKEEQVLRCLGAAVIAQWDDLPTDVQRKLFQRATSGNASHKTIQLKEQIARFLHDHKK